MYRYPQTLDPDIEMMVFEMMELSTKDKSIDFLRVELIMLRL